MVLKTSFFRKNMENSQKCVIMHINVGKARAQTRSFLCAHKQSMNDKENSNESGKSKSV